MMSQNFDLLATTQLNRRKKLTNFALYLVWVGAGFASLASIYTLSRTGVFPSETFISSILALGASIPVFFEKKKIDQILNQREAA